MTAKSAKIQSLATYRSRGVVRPECRPLRIVLFARHPELFGAERALLRLAKGFAQWPDFQPLVAVPADGGLSQGCRTFGIPVLVSGHAPLGGNPGSAGSAPRHLVRNLRSWPRMMRRLIRFGPDVIYTSTAHVITGAVAAHQLNIAHVWRVQELRTPRRHVGYVPTWSLLKRLMKSDHTHVVGNSQAVRAHFAKLLKTNSVTTIYEGFDFPPLPRLAAGDRYRKHITHAPTVQLATAGMLVANKGHDDAIQALADLIHRGHRVHLNIAGDGDPDYIGSLHELARRRHVEQSVTFHGFATEPGQIFEQSAITLSCGHAEGFGRAAVESLSRGIPVIGADNGGLPEIVRPGRTGLLYPVGDWRALSDRVQALLGNRQLYTEIAATGAVWTRQHFPARRYVREMGELVTRAALERQPELRHEINTGPSPLKSPLVEEVS